MPFIGQQPITGAYSKLDSITTSATATYNLQLNGGAYYPQSANHLLVSLNGVMQAPQDSFTVSGSQITFASALTSSDSIDFIMALGDVLDIGVPSDGAVNTSQLANSAVTDAKIASGISASKLTTGTLPSAQMPVGSIIQAKSATVTGNLGSGVQDLVSVSITPTDNTNKILVMGNTSAYTPSGATSWVDVYRDATYIYRSAVGVGYGSNARVDAASPIHLDDPQTTSAITYKLRGNSTGSSPGSWNYYTSGNTASTSITVMEVVV